VWPVTEVEFHTGVADSIGFACRLLRKAYRSGARVLVTAPPAVLNRLDQQLWAFDERDFVPHVRVSGSATSVQARTPIWLVASADVLAGSASPRLVVNLGADAPPDAATLDRLIEVVGADPEETQRGRERWRAYKAAGLQIVHHNGSELRG
jgi:DNA polymerase-3 subunit chi